MLLLLNAMFRKYFDRIFARQIVFYLFVIGTVFVVFACQNPQAKFCRTAAKHLCAKAYTCGENALQNIGIVNGQKIEDCENDIVIACTALDGAYSVELSRSCLQHINHTTCDELTQDGKPETCDRLF